MPFSHFYISPRLSITYPKLTLLRIKWPLSYIIFILSCISFNTALAGEIFSTGFESGSINAGEKLQNGFYFKASKNTSVSSENPKTGNYSLKFRFPAVGSEGNKYSSASRHFNLGGHYPDLWIKYDLYIPQNYTHRNSGGPGSYNNKFMMLWAGTYDGANREGPIIGGHFWPNGRGTSTLSAWAVARINGVVKLDKNWNCSTCGDGKSSHGIVDEDKGHWMTLVIHTKYASISNNDGVYEVWKTNWRGETEKLINIHNGPWYATKPNSNEPARGFDQGYLLGWANSGFVEETVLYMDNLTFSTTPLTNDYAYVASPKPPSVFIE